MRNRMILVLVAIIVVALLLACGSGGLISKAPTPTPTKTPRPTFTVTLTPTDTPVPTDTPTPTDTATPTPLPTNTPIVYTATPTPMPTDTPVPPTNTPKPTSRPRPQPTKTPTPRPLPTNTPKPQWQWTGEVVWDVRYQANCGGVGIAKQSIIKDRSGAVINGARVQLDCYGNIFISHASGTPGEYDPGHYDFWGLSTQPVNYTCTMQMYDVNGVRVQSSQTVTVSFDTGPCEPGAAGHQVAIVNWTKQY